MKKRWTLAVLAAALALTLAACKGGAPSYSVRIDPETGAGSAEFTIAVPKNDVDGCGNNFDKEGEEGYITTPDDMFALLKKSVSADFEVAMEDVVIEEENDKGEIKDKGNYALTIKFSFTDINDYNKKLDDLVGDSWSKYETEAKAYAESQKAQEITLRAWEDPWVDITRASLVKEGDTITFKEDIRVLNVIAYWAADTLRQDTTVFKDMLASSGSPAEIVRYMIDNLFSEYTLRFGEEKEVVKLDDCTDPVVTMTFGVEVPETTLPPTTAPSDKDTDGPGALPFIIGGIVAAAVVVAVVAVLVMKKKK